MTVSSNAASSEHPGYGRYKITDKTYQAVRAYMTPHVFPRHSGDRPSSREAIEAPARACIAKLTRIELQAPARHN